MISLKHINDKIKAAQECVFLPTEIWQLIAGYMVSPLYSKSTEAVLKHLIARRLVIGDVKIRSKNYDECKNYHLRQWLIFAQFRGMRAIVERSYSLVDNCVCDHCVNTGNHLQRCKTCQTMQEKKCNGARECGGEGECFTICKYCIKKYPVVPPRVRIPVIDRKKVRRYPFPRPEPGDAGQMYDPDFSIGLEIYRRGRSTDNIARARSRAAKYVKRQTYKEWCEEMEGRHRQKHQYWEELGIDIDFPLFG